MCINLASLGNVALISSDHCLSFRAAQVNPKLPVSQWVINMMQRTYQRSSMMQLLDVVKRTHPLTEYAHW